MRTSISAGPPLASARPTAAPTSAAFSTRSPGTPSARAKPTKSISGRLGNSASAFRLARLIFSNL